LSNNYIVYQSHSQNELKAILDLRYEILRKPWDQPAATATDEREPDSVNAYIKDENGNVVACGRLQENEGKVGQIRFMAVSDKAQGKGLGKLVVKFLEEKAREMKLVKVELQARENAVKFYESCGYTIREKSFLLWGIIQHYLMEKNI
jgi:N-acetylglutamate synthase-like GNAT family acetyltransferase